MKDREKRKELMENLRSLKADEIAARERDETEQLFWLRFKKRGKQLENTASFGMARRTLARIKTVRHEAELKKTKGASV